MITLVAPEAFDRIVRHRGRGFRLGMFLAAGAVTGCACVVFMWAFDFVLRHCLDASRIGPWLFGAKHLYQTPAASCGDVLGYRSRPSH